jgi:hypothetical protein
MNQKCLKMLQKFKFEKLIMLLLTSLPTITKTNYFLYLISILNDEFSFHSVKFVYPLNML